MSDEGDLDEVLNEDLNNFSLMNENRSVHNEESHMS